MQVPFAPGRTDASQEWTDVESFAVLEPTADGFRNYLQAGQQGAAEELLVERACMLTLTAPELTALVGGMRVLNANTGQSEHGALTPDPPMKPVLGESPSCAAARTAPCCRPLMSRESPATPG